MTGHAGRDDETVAWALAAARGLVSLVADEGMLAEWWDVHPDVLALARQAAALLDQAERQLAHLPAREDLPASQARLLFGEESAKMGAEPPAEGDPGREDPP